MIDANDPRLTPYEREIAAMRGDGAKAKPAAKAKAKKRGR